jgi:hypothetical protein
MKQNPGFHGPRQVFSSGSYDNVANLAVLKPVAVFMADLDEIIPNG